MCGRHSILFVVCLFVCVCVFARYGVDLVFNGHVHAYERTHPMYRYKVDNCGPMYVTIGDGGNIEG
jgi:hypothetical protein